VRLTQPADSDFAAIIDWPHERFGPIQARRYADTIVAALNSLGEGPAAAGAMERDDIAKGLMTLHVARGGRKGRHILLLRLGTEQEELSVDVLRILHDAMDLYRHVSDD
jgi:toxin ParE1/3/4